MAPPTRVRLFTGVHRQKQPSFSGHLFIEETIKVEVALAMTIRIIPILAVAIMIGPSLTNGSPACMTESEARAKFPKAHLIWLGTDHCWTFGAAPVHSPRTGLAAAPVPTPRPELAAAPVPTPRPELAAVPVPTPRPVLVAEPVPWPRPVPAPEPSVSDDVTAVQCRYSPCE